MDRRYFVAGFTFGLIGIILGAFATHGLKPLLSAQSIDSFETGVKYQIYHALLLLIVGIIKCLGLRISNWVLYLLLAGIILFSGSIYMLATNSLTSFNFNVIALVTPLGGSLLIVGWFILLGHFIKLKNK